MALQLAALRAALAAGMPRRGWKVGIHVPELRERLGLRHPGVGWLDGRRIVASGSPFAAPPGARLHVEPELAIRLARPLPPSASAEAARAAIAGVAPALEIVDYARPSDGLREVLAHSMFHAGGVVGALQPLASAAGLGTQWPVLRVGSRPGPPARPDLVEPDLGALVAFVAAFLASFGQSLEPGDLVLSGSYAERAVPVQAGDEVRADFGALGGVSVRIEAPPAVEPAAPS